MALINCPECGKEYSSKANACPNCGCPTNYSLVQNTNNIELDKSVDDSKINDDSSDTITSNKHESNHDLNTNKKFKFKWYYLFVFPLIPYYLIWKKSAISKNNKIILTILYTMLILLFGNNNDSKNVSNTIEEKSNFSSFQISVPYTKVYIDELIKLTILTNPTLENYDNLSCFVNSDEMSLNENLEFSLGEEGEFEIYCSVGNDKSNILKLESIKGISQIEKVKNLGLPESFLEQFINLYNSKDFGEIWEANIDSTNGELTVVKVSTYEVDLIVYFKNNVIVKVEDLKGVKIFDEGIYNKNYLYIRDISENFSSFRDNSMETVKSNLKSPSSAEFPGSFWDGYDGWLYFIKDNVVTISSYVDSQNSFGAMIRNEFIVQYTIVDKKVSLTYLLIGDKESGEFK